MQRAFALGLAALLPVLIGAATPAGDTARDAEAAATEARLIDRYLGGKVAGEPESCISVRQLVRPVVVSDRTLLFRTSGSLVYRNDLQQACPGMRASPALPIIETRGTTVCRGTIVTVPRGNEPSCQMGDFVAYRTIGG